jgi:hypothetical protein
MKKIGCRDFGYLICDFGYLIFGYLIEIMSIKKLTHIYTNPNPNPDPKFVLKLDTRNHKLDTQNHFFQKIGLWIIC